ncbi:MAG: FtsQ-type POTRA domain-containing protein [Oscillospiraceae bacterium]|nr:FtsQ-type POTRA domain-containing protein [Oscillospiraceae bacterium]
MPNERNAVRSRRQRRQSLLLRLFIVLIIAGVLLLASMLFFRVEYVVIEGATHHSIEEIQAVADVGTGRMLFATPRRRVRQRLLNAFPYLRDVNVRLRLPGTIVLQLDERQAMAYIDQDGQRWMIDYYGRLLEVTAPNTEVVGFALRGIGLYEPQVNTYFSSPDHVQQQTYELLLPAFRKHGFLDSLDELDLTALADITFSLHGRFTVRLGVISDLDYKLRLLTEMLQQLEQERPNARGTITLVDAAEQRRALFSEDIDWVE